MCQESYQKEGLVESDNIEYENYLGCRKYWWFWGESNTERG